MRPRAASSLLLLLCVAACTRSHAAEPPAPAVPEVRSGADIRLPFDAYLTPADQQRTVSQAEQRLARTCMRRFGLDWPDQDQPPLPTAPPNARRYGVIDAAEVARIGYHPPADPAPDPKAVKPADPTPEMTMVYGGKGGVSELRGVPIPDGGCLGEARRKLGIGDYSAGSADLNRIPTDSFALAQRDPRYTAVTAAWSACMRTAGYPYADIWRANNDPRWSAATPSALELATAKADVACKLSTRLPTVLLTVETEIQTAAIRHNAEALDRARDRQKATLAEATAVLAQPAATG